MPFNKIIGIFINLLFKAFDLIIKRREYVLKIFFIQKGKLFRFLFQYTIGKILKFLCEFFLKLFYFLFLLVISLLKIFKFRISSGEFYAVKILLPANFFALYLDLFQPFIGFSFNLDKLQLIFF